MPRSRAAGAQNNKRGFYLNSFVSYCHIFSLIAFRIIIAMFYYCITYKLILWRINMMLMMLLLLMMMMICRGFCPIATGRTVDPSPHEYTTKYSKSQITKFE